MAQPNAFFSRPRTPDDCQSDVFQYAKKPEHKGHYGRRVGLAGVHINAEELKLSPSDAKALSNSIIDSGPTTSVLPDIDLKGPPAQDTTVHDKPFVKSELPHHDAISTNSEVQSPVDTTDLDGLNQAAAQTEAVSGHEQPILSCKNSESSLFSTNLTTSSGNLPIAASMAPVGSVTEDVASDLPLTDAVSQPAVKERRAKVTKPGRTSNKPSKTIARSSVQCAKYTSASIASILMQKLEQEHNEAAEVVRNTLEKNIEQAQVIQTLQCQISEYQQNMNDLKEDNEKLKAKQSTSDAQAGKLKTKALHMKKFFDGMGSDYQVLRREADKMNASINELSESSKTFSYMSSSIEDYEKLLQQAADQDKVLRKELSDMSGQLAEASIESKRDHHFLDRLSDLRNYMKSEFSSLKTMAMENPTHVIVANSKQINQSTDTISEGLSSLTEGLEKSSAAREMALSKLTFLVDASNTASETAKAHHNDTKGILDAHLSAFTTLTQDLIASQARFDELQAANGILKAQSNAQASEVERLRETARRHEDLCTTAVSECATAKSDLETALQREKQSSQSQQTQSQTLIRYEFDLDNQRNKLGLAEAKLESYSREIKHLESKLGKREQECKELQDKIALEFQELDRLCTANKSLTEERSTSKTQIEELQRGSAECNLQNTKLTAELERLQKLGNNLSNQSEKYQTLLEHEKVAKENTNVELQKTTELLCRVQEDYDQLIVLKKQLVLTIDMLKGDLDLAQNDNVNLQERLKRGQAINDGQLCMTQREVGQVESASHTQNVATKKPRRRVDRSTNTIVVENVQVPKEGDEDRQADTMCENGTEEVPFSQSTMAVFESLDAIDQDAVDDLSQMAKRQETLAEPIQQRDDLVDSQHLRVQETAQESLPKLSQMQIDSLQMPDSPMSMLGSTPSPARQDENKSETGRGSHESSQENSRATYEDTMGSLRAKAGSDKVQTAKVANGLPQTPVRQHGPHLTQRPTNNAQFASPRAIGCYDGSFTTSDVFHESALRSSPIVRPSKALILHYGHKRQSSSQIGSDQSAKRYKASRIPSNHGSPRVNNSQNHSIVSETRTRTVITSSSRSNTSRRSSRASHPTPKYMESQGQTSQLTSAAHSARASAKASQPKQNFGKAASSRQNDRYIFRFSEELKD